ncbi:hypothetical protein E2986_13368 [Frieseomelitta varia]|uniref:Mid1-interacting protein n=1 Tax=Frieseomelitta varia TaxID=561572 RepID=A0A833W9Y1_9HYME|nr:uncharacterized protein LOC122531270 [Frieseomelitta varia]KAF3425503.1 hypothetical protein E2986_13368 [Frieseomelitta varia]
MSCKRASLQRLIKHDVTAFSNTSILNSMERFIRTVREMEDTILIPSRLLDLTVGDSQDNLQLEDKRSSVIKATLANVDLYRLYNIINQMKIEVLWSQDHMNNAQNLEDPALLQKFIRARNSSNTSMHSIQSVCTSCNSEFDIVTENDSEAENEDSVSVAARSFKRHLHGLHHNIEKMILAAEYLILRYQTAIDSQA